MYQSFVLPQVHDKKQDTLGKMGRTHFFSVMNYLESSFTNLLMPEA